VFFFVWIGVERTFLGMGAATVDFATAASQNGLHDFFMIKDESNKKNLMFSVIF
jgi:hypothetical protein